MSNTKLELLYKDADGYTASARLVVIGSINNSHIKSIKASLIEGQYFIPHQVGLPTPSETLVEKYSFDEESDHAWTTLEGFEDGMPTPPDMLTKQSPTGDLTVQEFVRRLVNTQWDEVKEIERLMGLI